jgi:hypothetical protein
MLMCLTSVSPSIMVMVALASALKESVQNDMPRGRKEILIMRMLS